MVTRRLLAVTVVVVIATAAPGAALASTAPKWHKLSAAALEQTVRPSGWAPRGLQTGTSVFHLPQQPCANWHSPPSLTAEGIANKPTKNSFQQILVRVNQVTTHSRAVAAVATRKHSRCVGTVALTMAGLPKGAVAWADGSPLPGIDVNVALAVGDAVVEVQISPPQAFGKQSQTVLRHALAVTVAAYRKTALR